jgi:hypothetical protein
MYFRILKELLDLASRKRISIDDSLYKRTKSKIDEINKVYQPRIFAKD